MRQSGAVWRGVWAITFAFVCVYIAFEVLDIDGSQLQLDAGFVITAEASSAEVDRVLREGPTPLVVRLLSDSIVTPRLAQLQFARNTLRLPGADIPLPRQGLAHPGCSSSSQSADPL